MIKLVYEGKCKECPVSELEVDHVESFEFGNYWVVRCVHEKACDRMVDKVLRMVGEESNAS